MMESYTTKLPAWKHEKEHRIVLEKEFLSINSSDVDSKKFNYNFKILKGMEIEKTGAQNALPLKIFKTEKKLDILPCVRYNRE